jgi:hypothetical protein
MSYSELHQLERARAHQLTLEAGRWVGIVAELALVSVVVSVWFLTCMAG